jgi:hypothetical protein
LQYELAKKKKKKKNAIPIELTKTGSVEQTRAKTNSTSAYGVVGLKAQTNEGLGSTLHIVEILDRAPGEQASRQKKKKTSGQGRNRTDIPARRSSSATFRRA